jgi:hypothetical protein
MQNDRIAVFVDDAISLNAQCAVQIDDARPRSAGRRRSDIKNHHG